MSYIYRLVYVTSSDHRAHLLLEVGAAESEDVGDNGECDEVVIRHKLGRSKGGKRVKKEFTSTLELSDREKVKPAVDFQSVPAIPVAALLNQPVGYVRVFRETRRTNKHTLQPSPYIPESSSGLRKTDLSG